MWQGTQEERAGFWHKPPSGWAVTLQSISSSLCVQTTEIQQGESNIEDKDARGQPWADTEGTLLLPAGQHLSSCTLNAALSFHQQSCAHESRTAGACRGTLRSPRPARS